MDISSTDPTAALASAAALGALTPPSRLHKYALAIFFLVLALFFGVWWSVTALFSKKPAAEKAWSGVLFFAFLGTATLLAVLTLMGYVRGRGGSADLTSLLGSS